MCAILFCISLFVIMSMLVYGGRREFSHIIMVGMLLRIAILAVDMSRIYPSLLHASGDAEGFHETAMLNVAMSRREIATNYPIFLTYVYMPFIGDNPRLVGQFINVCLGTGVILVVRRCLALIEAPRRIRRIVILIMSLSPNIAILSGLLLREAWIEFFVALSFMYFLRWFLCRGPAVRNMLLSILSLFAASYMHFGAIGLAAGYMCAFVLYRPAQGRVVISAATLVPMIVVVLCSLVFLANIDTLGSKASSLAQGDSNTDEVIARMGHTEDNGGANYLTWLDTPTMALTLLFLPLRMVYFLFSPLPVDWRGAGDMVAFCLDSMIYLSAFWLIFRSRESDGRTRIFKRFALVSLFAVSVFFGMGTFNSGTAMRHRAKILSVLLLTCAAVYRPRERAAECKKRGIPR